MDSGQITEKLELALIELEYAAADFLHNPASLPPELDDLKAMRSRMTAAKCALDLAIQILTVDSHAEPEARNFFA